jgi:protein ImuA
MQHLASSGLLRAGRTERLARLHDKLRTLATPRGAGVLPFGDTRIDAHLPGGGLPLGQLHEVHAVGIEAETGAIMAGFAASLLGRLPGKRALFWIAPGDDLYPPGLPASGLDPARLVLVHTPDDAATLAAMETCLREGVAEGVIGEIGAMERIASRRLHLACQRHGTTGFVLRRWPYGRDSEDREASAAMTRWRLAPAPSDLQGPEPGTARWQVKLLHARGGREGEWIMQAGGENHEAGTQRAGAAPHALRVVAGMADDTPAAERRHAV